MATGGIDARTSRSQRVAWQAVPGCVMAHKCPRCGLFNLPTSERCDCGFDLARDIDPPEMPSVIVQLRLGLAMRCAMPSAVFAIVALVDWLARPLWLQYDSRFLDSLHRSLLQAALASPVTTAAAVWLSIPAIEWVHPVVRLMIVMLCVLSGLGAAFFWLPYLGLIFRL